MIDELDRVRRFRADEPPPSEVTRDRAGAALAEAMAAPPGRPIRPRRSTTRKRPSRRRWLLRTAAVAAVALVCVAAVELAGSGSGTGPTPALAAALNRLAQIAATGPSLVPGPGQYLYVESKNDYPADAYAGHQTCVTYASDLRQVWIASNGSGLLEDTIGPTRFTSPQDEATCRSMRPSPLTPSGSSRLWFAAGCFELGPGNDMQGLSTDPRTLLIQMRRLDGGTTSPGEDFVHIGDFLRETDASPAVRAALYRAAALIPGVHLLGMVSDHIGRRGLGVAYEEHGDRSELIFDARTAALMAEQSSGAGGGSWAVYLQSRLVDHLPARAPIPLAPPCVNGGGIVKHTATGDVQTGA